MDATGDAVLADLCGAPCREAGRDTPKIMPPSLCSLCAGINWGKIKMGGFSPTDVQQIVPVEQQEKVEKAMADGHFSEPEYCVPGMLRVGRSVGFLNAPHLYDVNALRCKSLTEGMIKGRQLAQEYIEFYKRYITGFENMEHITTATLMGVRESRRIVGEYELNYDDYLARRQFPDQIGVYNAPVDIHPCDRSYEGFRRHREESKEGSLGPGECFGIPYSILVPKGWKNLWVAGRCVSTDIEVHGVIRVQPSASMMGQAAGTAAAMCVKQSVKPRDLDTDELRKILTDQGVVL